MDNENGTLMLALLLMGGVAFVLLMSHDAQPAASYYDYPEPVPAPQVPMYQNDEEYEWTDYKGNTRHMKIKRNVKGLQQP